MFTAQSRSDDLRLIGLLCC